MVSKNLYENFTKPKFATQQTPLINTHIVFLEYNAFGQWNQKKEYVDLTKSKWCTHISTFTEQK